GPGENLPVNHAGDHYEQEADRVAGSVLGMKQPVGEVELPRHAEPVHGHAGHDPGGGEALPTETRRFFEPRFGQRFANVRVHSDRAANESALGLGARAYTAGERIAFAPGEYQPSTPRGRELLAHELAHVVQQSRAPQLGRTHTPAASLSRVSSPAVQ